MAPAFDEIGSPPQEARLRTKDPAHCFPLRLCAIPLRKPLQELLHGRRRRCTRPPLHIRPHPEEKGVQVLD